MTRPSARWAAPLALAAAFAQAGFVASWAIVGALEGHGYRPMRDDISDLGALTAHHPTAIRLALFVTGAITVAFGLLVVGPALGSVWSGVLVALSLPAFDNLTDAFFRLDCRAADAGCSTSDAVSSWHGTMHLVCFGIAAVATVAAPFVIARAMSRRPDWRGWARGTRRFGIATVVLLVLAGAASGTAVQGGAQRLAATVIPAALAVLALQVAGRVARRVDALVEV